MKISGDFFLVQFFKGSILTLLALFIGNDLLGQPQITLFKKQIRFLTSSKMEGRFSGGKTETILINYLVNSLSQNGKAIVKVDAFQTKIKINGVEKLISTSNIRAFIDNKAKSTVILTAHFDHLGFDSLHISDFKGNNTLYPGADDNASGISVLLQMFSKRKLWKSNSNYLFLFTSGEEIGLLGSKYFVENQLKEYPNISYVINLDMVGRFNPSTKFLAYCGSWLTTDQQNTLKLAQHSLISLQNSCPNISDHQPFYESGINCLYITSGIHSDYHRPSDTAKKLNYNKMNALMKLLVSLVAG